MIDARLQSYATVNEFFISEAIKRGYNASSLTLFLKMKAGYNGIKIKDMFNRLDYILNKICYTGFYVLSGSNFIQVKSVSQLASALGVDLLYPSTFGSMVEAANQRLFFLDNLRWKSIDVSTVLKTSYDNEIVVYENANVSTETIEAGYDAMYAATATHSASLYQGATETQSFFGFAASLRNPHDLSANRIKATINIKNSVLDLSSYKKVARRIQYSDNVTSLGSPSELSGQIEIDHFTDPGDIYSLDIGKNLQFRQIYVPATLTADVTVFYDAAQ